MKIVRFLLTFIFIILAAGGGYFYSQFRGFDKNAPKERYVVKLNTSEEQIIDDLQTNGFLRNKKIFTLILDFKERRGKTISPKPANSADQRIEPGSYMISKGMNAYEMAGVFIYGPFQKWVVIPPGKRKEQTALIIKNALDWPYSITRNFVNIADEGYLYPDTYLVDIDADPQQVWQKLFTNFNEKFDAQLQQDLLEQNIRNDTAIKMASLIERESGGDEDKPIIAGIIWNRLNKKMKLEIDATVQYAIASETLNEVGLQDLTDFNFWPPLGAGIVRTVSSPYNTYLIKALPEGPICSPSIESIRAVAFPAETDALYYLHSPDKQIHTAKTLQEHYDNIEKYLK